MKCSTQIFSAFFAASALSFAVCASSAQSAPPQLIGIAHVALNVSDVDTEVQFFAKLGFQSAFSLQGNSRAPIPYIKINDREFIELHQGATSGNGAAMPLGLMHVCFETADVKLANAGYAAAGLHPTPVNAMTDGNQVFSIADPAGRITEVLQYMPGSKPMAGTGQHLDKDRISDELVGYELQVTNLSSMQKFYEALGFQAESDDVTTRLSLPANPDVRIVLRAAQSNSRPKFFFPIDDAKKTAEELHRANLQVVRDKKLVFVIDPDGNTFVLLETGDHSPRHE